MSVGHKAVVRGIVVGVSPSGDGSLRVRMYTDVLGLVWAFAKSAREERSKLRAHLLSGTRGIFSLVKGRDTWRITGASATQNVHFASSGSSYAQTSAARVLSFVRQFVRVEGSDPYFFETLWNFFEGLPYPTEAIQRDAECVAILRMLAALGYVDPSPSLLPFLEEPYAPSLIKGSNASRAILVKAVNDGMSASGL